MLVHQTFDRRAARGDRWDIKTPAAACLCLRDRGDSVCPRPLPSGRSGSVSSVAHFPFALCRRPLAFIAYSDRRSRARERARGRRSTVGRSVGRSLTANNATFSAFVIVAAVAITLRSTALEHFKSLHSPFFFSILTHRRIRRSSWPTIPVSPYSK